MGIARKPICCRRLKNSMSGNMDELVSFVRSIQVLGPIWTDLSVLNSWHETAFFCKANLVCVHFCIFVMKIWCTSKLS